MMHFVKLEYDHGTYEYAGSNDLGMTILGRFLFSDVGCIWTSFKEWALDDSDLSTNSNITSLEKEGGYIYLADLYSEEKVPTMLKMTKEQFIKILDDWESKVCKLRPLEVIIMHRGGEFIIETRNS